MVYGWLVGSWAVVCVFFRTTLPQVRGKNCYLVVVTVQGPLREIAVLRCQMQTGHVIVITRCYISTVIE